MRATNLPSILRGAGLMVVVHVGADTRGQGELAGVEAIFVHHTGSASMPGAVNVVRDGREGLRGLLSQLALDPDGRWHYLGSRQAWHAGTGGPLPSIPANLANSRTISIEGVSSGGSWTAAQRWSYPRGVAALADAFRLPTSRVVRHQDWAPRRKTDAGVWTTATFRRDVDWHRTDLKRAQSGRFLSMLTDTEQDELLAKTRDIHKQLFGPWQTRRFGRTEQPGHTLVDLVRVLDVELLSWIDLAGRPGPEADTMLGQVVSTRADVRTLRAQLDRIEAALPKAPSGA